MAFLDRVRDPEWRFWKFVGLGATLVGVVVAVLVALRGGDDKPDIPVIEGEIEHLSTPSGLEDAEEGDVLRLKLAANSVSIDMPPDVDPMCEEYSPGSHICEVRWVDDCDEATSAADLAETPPLSRDGCRYMNIRTVDEARTSVAGWSYNDGHYELTGYYAVEATAYQNDSRHLNLREVPPEVAGQMAR
jgi:hypothetical protein